jgi:hypothetical protein
MSKQIEAMKLALKTLEQWDDPFYKRGRAIAVLQEALAEQPAQQEPFGYFRYDIQLDAWVKSKEANVGVAFYTEPPKREWVGLTEDEFDDLRDNNFGISPLISAVEAKLKEKNT